MSEPTGPRLAHRTDGTGHWLKVTDGKIAGCHCGFVADTEADSGYGDSVLDHFEDVVRGEEAAERDRLLALVAAQAEQIAELRGEVERLQLPEAIVGAAQQFAIGSPFSLAETTNTLQGVVGLIDRAERAEAALSALHATDDYQRWALVVVERDAAREAVGRVRALPHEAWCCNGCAGTETDCRCLVATVRAALEGGAVT